MFRYSECMDAFEAVISIDRTRQKIHKNGELQPRAWASRI